MTIEIKAPTLPESIEDGIFCQIHAYPGELVHRDDLLFEIETDKVILEVVAPGDGKVTEYLVNIGDHVLSNQVLGFFEQCEAPAREHTPEQEILLTEHPKPTIESNTQDQTAPNHNRLPTILVSILFGVVCVALTLIAAS